MIKTMQLLSEPKNTNDVHVHPNITFYLFIASIFIIIIIMVAFYFKLYQPIARKIIFLPIRNIEIEIATVENLYPSINNIDA
jgi:hypothetical protein